jgi:hypothetical protein
MSAIFSAVLRLVVPFFLVPETLSSQPRAMSATTALADWGLTSPQDVRFGVLSVIHSTTSDRLAVSVLRPASNTPWQMIAPFAPSEHRSPLGRHRTKPLSRATWIWNTDTLLTNTEEENATLSTVGNGHFDKIFLQLPRNFTEDTSGDGQLRDLVARLRLRGALVYALCGGPEFSLPENHSVVGGLIQRVNDYNKSSSGEARFVGFHFDTEPYFLPGFGGSRRNWILEQYLTVTELAARLCHSRGLLFGVDIPFWYDVPDEFTGKVDSLEFSGTKKTANEFVTDWSDEICIMSYRTTIQGANAIVSVSRSELDYAEKQGKTVFVGLETSSIPDEDHVYIRGIPATDTTMLGTTEQVVVMTVSGDSVNVSLVTRSDACSMFKAQRDCCTPPPTMFLWEVSNSSHIPSTSLSFAELGRKRLDETIDTVIQQLSEFLSFGGVAIHHAASYARLPE